MRVCLCMRMCIWRCGSLTGSGNENRCNNTGGTQGRPNTTTAGRPGSQARRYPTPRRAKSPTDDYWNLLSSPTVLIHATHKDIDALARTITLLDSPFCNLSTHDGSLLSRSSDAVAPSSRRLWSSCHRTPVQIKANHKKPFWVYKPLSRRMCLIIILTQLELCFKPPAIPCFDSCGEKTGSLASNASW